MYVCMCVCRYWQVLMHFLGSSERIVCQTIISEREGGREGVREGEKEGGRERVRERKRGGRKGDEGGRERSLTAPVEQLD